MSTLRIAWRSLGRNPRRTALTVFAILLGQFAFVCVAGLLHGYGDALIDTMTGPLVGHVQVHAEEWREDRAMDLTIDSVDSAVAVLRADPLVRGVAPRVYGPALGALGELGHAVVVVGVDFEAESGPGGLLEGVELAPASEGRALIGAGLERVLGGSVGRELAIVGQALDGSIANDLFRVRQVIRTPVDLVNRQGILVSIEDAQALFAMEDMAHEITVWGRDVQGAEALATRMGARSELGAYEVLAWPALVPELTTIIETQEATSFVLLFLVFLAAAAGIANTTVMATFERRREFGMLLALGTAPGRIVRMVMLEATILGVVGVALGSALGAAAVIYMGGEGFSIAALGGEEVTELTFGGISFSFSIFPRFEMADALYGVGAVMFTSMLTAFGPARRSSRLHPVEAMRG